MSALSTMFAMIPRKHVIAGDAVIVEEVVYATSERYRGAQGDVISVDESGEVSVFYVDVGSNVWVTASKVRKL